MASNDTVLSSADKGRSAQAIKREDMRQNSLKSQNFSGIRANERLSEADQKSRDSQKKLSSERRTNFSQKSDLKGCLRGSAKTSDQARDETASVKTYRYPVAPNKTN